MNAIGITVQVQNVTRLLSGRVHSALYLALALLTVSCSGESETPSPSPTSAPSMTPADTNSPAPSPMEPSPTPSSSPEPTPVMTPEPTPITTPEPTPVYVPPGEPVEILIDQTGMAHLYAQNDEDLFFASGYQLAQDRLYQLEMLRRFALGRLSEVLGEDGLYRDVESRTFDFPRWGRLDYHVMQQEDPERVLLLRAWVAGINSRIAEVRAGLAPLPFGYGPDGWDFLPEPWQPEDPYIVLKGAGFALDLTLSFEYAVSLIYSLYPEAMASVEVLKPAHPVYSVPEAERPQATARPSNGRPSSGRPSNGRPATTSEESAAKRSSKSAPSKAPTLEQLRTNLKLLQQLLPGFPRASGSNNWAVEGRFTEDGRPLLAGDPHLSFDFFGAPYPLHLNSKAAGGSYDVVGFAYPGTPGIAIGHNDAVIWTPTSAFGDVMDIWSVTVRNNMANMGGTQVPVTQRTEEIIVRAEGKPAGEGRIERRTYESIEGYGVIVPAEVLGLPTVKPLLCHWTGFTGRPARWFMELNRASSRDELETTIDRMKEMNYNFIGADASGITFRTGIDVPRRQSVSEERAPWRTMDASDPLSLWTSEMLSPDELPKSRGGNVGWLATANNDPFGFTGDGRIDNDPWFYGAFFDPGYRAARISTALTELTSRQKVSLQDMQALQMDTHSTLADDLLPLLETAWTHAQSDPTLAEYKEHVGLSDLVSLLTSDWDRRMATDSAGALAFEFFIQAVTEETLRDDIPSAYDFAMELQTVYVLKIAALALQGGYPNGSAVLQEGVDAIVLEAAKRTADWLKAGFGAVQPATYTYGARKRTNFNDAYGYLMPLFAKPSPGGEDTICVSQNIHFSEEAATWDSTYVSVERMVGRFLEDGTPEAWVNYPVGPASDPTSQDTLTANENYLAGRYHKLLFDRAEIEAQLRSSSVLIPAPLTPAP